MKINKEHNIYVIRAFGKNNKTIVKLGYSSQIDKRIQNYFSHNPMTEVIWTCFIEDGKILEKVIHKIEDSLYKKEWYKEQKLQTLLGYIIDGDIDWFVEPIEVDRIDISEEIIAAKKKESESNLNSIFRSIEAITMHFSPDVPGYIYDLERFLKNEQDARNLIKEYYDIYDDIDKYTAYINRLNWEITSIKNILYDTNG